MKSTYEARWWKLEKEQVPARSYIEKVSEGIEQADPRAEALTEVVNVLEGEVDILKAVWEVGGSLKAVKTTPSVPLPLATLKNCGPISAYWDAHGRLSRSRSPTASTCKGTLPKFGMSTWTTCWDLTAISCTPGTPTAASRPLPHGIWFFLMSWRSAARWSRSWLAG